MPFEISEIDVRLAVRDPRAPQAPAATPGHHAGPPAALTPAQREDIVQECVRTVLQTLRMMEAR